MIEGGKLSPECNFEVDWINYNKSAVKSEMQFFSILKDFLWKRGEKDVETYLMLNLNIANKDGDGFKEIYKNIGDLISKPNKKQPFQLIHEHMLEDAAYNFSYIDSNLPLTIKYMEYDGHKFLHSISQKGKNCDYEFQGDGGTQDQYITFRFMDNKGKIKSIRSSNFSNLPLELNEDNQEEYKDNIKEVSLNFFKYIKNS